VETFQTPAFSSKNVLSSDFQIKLCKRNVLFNDVSLRFWQLKFLFGFYNSYLSRSLAEFVFGISSAWWGVISISSSGKISVPRILSVAQVRNLATSPSLRQKKKLFRACIASCCFSCDVYFI